MTAQSALSYSALQIQCQNYLRRALSGLGVQIQTIYRMNLTPLILPCMAGTHRFFHNFEHLVAVGGQSDSIEMLAGAFHDLVYVHVDTGIPFNLTSFLNRVIQQIDGELVLRSQLPQNPEIHWLLKLFGLQPGQPLSPLQGQNEFLSALVAVQVLAPILSPEHRLAIATCIEATIPFRINKGSQKGSQGLPEVMLVRLRSIVQEHRLALTEAQLVEIVRRSVRVANRDVASFAQPTAVGFLADTWNLLPENNHQFSPQGLYRVQDYRRSIEKTERFFRTVNPHSIFRQFRGVPPTEVYQQWQEQANQNLSVGRLYLSCKLVAIALLEALSEPLGEQTTIAMMMGGLPSANGSSQGSFNDGLNHSSRHVSGLRLEDFLPSPHWSGMALSDVEKEVWQLLTEGRAESNHQGDLLNSPLAAFIVQQHGFARIPSLRRRAEAWLGGSLSTTDFLSHFDPPFMALLLEAIQRLWEQRQQAFRHHFWLQSETPAQFSGGGLANRSLTQRL